MKIHAFGVRDDEKQAFEQISAQCGVEVTLSDETPSLENADLVKGYEGVTVLGMGNIKSLQREWCAFSLYKDYRL